MTCSTGGVDDALNLDGRGKTLAYLLMDMPVQVPAESARCLGGEPVSGCGSSIVPDRIRRGAPQPRANRASDGAGTRISRVV
jgi:hypothetical protein